MLTSIQEWSKYARDPVGGECVEEDAIEGGKGSERTCREYQGDVRWQRRIEAVIYGFGPDNGTASNG